MAVGYGNRNIHKIDWKIVAVDIVGAIVGGLIGYMLSWIGLIGGIVLLIAMPYMNLKGTMKEFAMVLTISLIAGGIASIIAGGAQALDSQTLAQSDNMFAQISAIPMKINEKVFKALNIEKLQLTPEMIPESVAQSIVSQYAITGQSTVTGSTWGY